MMQIKYYNIYLTALHPHLRVSSPLPCPCLHFYMSHPYVIIGASHTKSRPNTATSKTKPELQWPIDTIGASAHPMAVFSGFYKIPGPPPSGHACGIVPPHRNGHWNGHQSGYILHLWIVCCCPGGRRGDMEWVVARWRHPVASGVALDMLHWAMPHVLLQRLRMVIKMACNGGAFVRHRRLFRLT